MNNVNAPRHNRRPWSIIINISINNNGNSKDIWCKEHTNNTRQVRKIALEGKKTTCYYNTPIVSRLLPNNSFFGTKHTVSYTPGTQQVVVPIGAILLVLLVRISNQNVCKLHIIYIRIGPTRYRVPRIIRTYVETNLYVLNYLLGCINSIKQARNKNSWKLIPGTPYNVYVILQLKS